MELVKKYSFYQLNNLLISKTVHFTSDCEFFPNFDIIVKVYKLEIKGNEILILSKTNKGKKFTIGSNMKNLKFEII